MDQIEFNELVRTKGRLMAEAIRDRQPVIEACMKVQLSERVKQGELKTSVIDKKCARISGEFCKACTSPDAKWKNGKCNLATHLYFENKGGRGEKQFIVTPMGTEPSAYIKEQQKLNPIKQSKRG
jgi:hypothetical protein